ncbi:hypothetical protein BLNAU_24940 [Blattamonas nauphoetae]|uniref:Uncharacterized protein n=1 Tax=Blattamonas nauphoetae TaxID=2049346 RepID=A0ABQ9WKZ5_9EUKA|nr:hypothetical protein BLNAU_24940 [Blattamonas nauphoetae]
MVCSDQTISQRNINTVIFVPRLRITELLLTSNKYKKTANPIKLCLSPLDFAQAKFPLIVPLASRTTKLKIGSKLLVSPLSILPFANTAYPPSPPSVYLLSMLGRLHKHDAKVVTSNEMDNPQSPLVNTSPTSEQNPSFCSDLISVLSLLVTNQSSHSIEIKGKPMIRETTAFAVGEGAKALRPGQSWGQLLNSKISALIVACDSLVDDVAIDRIVARVQAMKPL